MGAGYGGVTAADQADTQTIDIDAAIVFQTIDGFGASTFGGFGVFERGHCDQVVPAGVTYRTTESQREAVG